MSPLGLKAKEGNLIHIWQSYMCNTLSKIHLWCNTCQPLGGQHGRRADLGRILFDPASPLHQHTQVEDFYAEFQFDHVQQSKILNETFLG